MPIASTGFNTLKTHTQTLLSRTFKPKQGTSIDAGSTPSEAKAIKSVK